MAETHQQNDPESGLPSTPPDWIKWAEAIIKATNHRNATANPVRLAALLRTSSRTFIGWQFLDINLTDRQIGDLLAHLERGLRRLEPVVLSARENMNSEYTGMA